MTRSGKISAGQRIVETMNATLQKGLEWTELELFALDRAASAADRAERVQKLLDTEINGEARPAVVVKLSAELRLLERQVVDMVAKLNPSGVGSAKSPRHVHAAKTRWKREAN
ncbi:hypothetical protein J6397_30185 [Rhodococcus qingshengii]|uniref:hypothetical protein n=1 Tax=Rhodococcus qingshengii TaxID=334542 RepID=UPI001AE5DE91|nr:hypothetical protein [Rhodococcus qingshengii]MBP1054420.1 hypothetical protein [Rhodococcus qingshengii]